MKMSKTIDSISQNRRDHLEKKILENYKNVYEFCNKTGEDYGAVHRYLNSQLNIGNKVIKRFEQIFNVPQGAFDKSINEKEVIKIPIYSLASYLNNITKLKPENATSFHYIELDELSALGWKHENIFGLMAESQEMAPIIKSGAKVLIDKSSISIIDGAIYAILVNDKIFIRKIIHSLNKKTIVLIPENKEVFEKEELKINTYKIIGRAVYSCG